MSVQSGISGVHSIQSNVVDTIISSARTYFENLIGTLGTTLSNFWDGGFAGINENGLEDLVSAINTYCANIQGLIDEFNENAAVEIAYKGAIQIAAADFIKSVKEILQAYVSTIRRNVEESRVAFQNYAQGAQQISQSVSSDAQSVRSKANEIKLD